MSDKEKAQIVEAKNLYKNGYTLKNIAEYLQLEIGIVIQYIFDKEYENIN